MPLPLRTCRAFHLATVCVAALALGCQLDSMPVPEEAAFLPPFGMAALGDLASLPELRPPGWRVEQVSSYDRAGGNLDLGIGPDTVALLAALGLPSAELPNSYLYEEGNRFVIFDELGPGVVDRLWMTDLATLFDLPLAGDIAFELDDEPSPRLVLDREELFSGAHPPFIAPLAANAAASSGGHHSVTPIPFARRLRITTSNVPNWLQVTWTRLPAGTPVESFDPAADTSAAAARLSAIGAEPAPADEDHTAPVTIAAGESAVVWQHEGPGTVLAFELLGPAGADIPPGLRLDARFDDAESPQIEAPLDDLFGASLGPGARSPAFGREGDRFYFHLRMPFRARAELSLFNGTSQPFDGFRIRIAAAHRLLGRNPGTLHAAARSARLEPDGRDQVLLETGGTGHVVAVIATAGCGAAGACQLPSSPGFDGAHLEGDDRVRVDGSRSPQIHGTGFEDLFGGGFYFLRGPFTLPTHGDPAQAEASPRRPGINLRSAYRLFFGDAIPFASSIRFALEHGPVDDVPAEMSSLVFYYAVPEPSLRETDRVEIGDASSEALHAFTTEGRVDRSLTSFFPGDDPPLSARGLEAVRTRFRIAVDPRSTGVRLRRLADQAAGRQSAIVRVGGEVAGTWTSALSNPVRRFADLDFDLPPALTRGHEAVEIEIDASGSPAPWTAYGYAALCATQVER